MSESSHPSLREPKAQPPASQEEHRPFYVPILGVRAPQWMVDVVHTVRRPIMRDRQRFIHEMPNWLVDQSLKVVGAIYIASELAMLKAAGITFVFPERKGKWLNYLTDPVKNTVQFVLSRSFGSWNEFKTSVKSLGDWQHQKEKFGGLMNMDKAAEAELNWQAKRGIAEPNRKLVNRWQARATLFGFSMMALGFMLPDKRQTEEEADEMRQKAKEQPAAYVAERLKQAVDVTEYPKHKRQYVGLGLLLAGACSFISGFRTPGVHELTGKPTFFFNRAHSIGGLITIAGGSQLMLAAEDETGWSRYGATMMTRIATTYHSIKNRFINHNQDRLWYAGATAGFQSLSFLSFMLGGAKKEKPDATKAGEQGKEPVLRVNEHSVVKNSSHSENRVPVYSIEHCGTLEAAARQELGKQSDGYAV
jgi:hypothetical protein